MSCKAFFQSSFLFVIVMRYVSYVILVELVSLLPTLIHCVSLNRLFNMSLQRYVIVVYGLLCYVIVFY